VLKYPCRVTSSDFLDLGSIEIKVEPTSNEIAREGYILTAADPADASPAEKLMQVISAKYVAGLLKPFNYSDGYKRLQNYISRK
jgi:hypothetical protein